MDSSMHRRAFGRASAAALVAAAGGGRRALAGPEDGYSQVAAVRLPDFNPRVTVAFSPDGKRLAVGMRVIDVESGTDLGPVILRAVTDSDRGFQRLYFLEDSREFVGSFDGHFVHGRAPEKVPPAADVVPVYALGNGFVTSDVYAVLAKAERGSAGECRFVHATPDGKAVVRVVDGRSVRVTSSYPGREVARLDQDETGLAVLLGNGSHVLILTSRGEQIWDCKDRVPDRMTKPALPAGYAIWHSGPDPAGRMLGTYASVQQSRSLVYAYDAGKGAWAKWLEFPYLATCVAASADGRAVAVGTADGGVRLETVAGGAAAQLLPAQSKQAGPKFDLQKITAAVAVSPDGRTVASVDGGGLVRLFSRGAKAPAPPASPDAYPLKVGTVWRYALTTGRGEKREMTREVVGREAVGGWLCAVVRETEFDNKVAAAVRTEYLHSDAATVSLVAHAERGEFGFFRPLPPVFSTRWKPGVDADAAGEEMIYGRRCKVTSSSVARGAVSAAVPAGEFVTVRVETVTTRDEVRQAASKSHYAPGVGLVRRQSTDSSGTSVAELVEVRAPK